MVKEIEKTISMIEYINDAIKEDRIVPVYQPILDAKTNKIYKYECLVRIKKANGELLSPFHFLEIAKQSEQYSKITKIMIQKTFEYMSKQNPQIEFSINLSSLDIENSEMKSFLFQKLDEYQLHKRLIIELLEDESVNDFNVVVKFINEVKKMGVRIAIDDYGSGYSNLERIFQFKPDFLKIDGSIIEGICENNIKLAIAKSAVNLAKEIGIKTISEYISNKQIYHKAKEINIDFLQGYYISPPKEYI
jgi:EAL domain-containing protein (putative c-di-GMP-specific phosphodiesterase class I)